MFFFDNKSETIRTRIRPISFANALVGSPRVACSAEPVLFPKNLVEAAFVPTKVFRALIARRRRSRVFQALSSSLAFATMGLLLSCGSASPQAQGLVATAASCGIDLWEEPWVFETGGAQKRPFVALDSTQE